ncbi:unnamed protein product [Ectocarpus sp. CCAP 1310/34]|nr:unnamed protein product [Ectocarpus sp. CCAP 1310/34]
MKGASVFVRSKEEGWQLGVMPRVSRAREEDLPCNVQFVDLERRFNVSPSPAKYCTAVDGPPGSWCFLVHMRSWRVRRTGT